VIVEGRWQRRGHPPTVPSSCGPRSRAPTPTGTARRLEERLGQALSGGVAVIKGRRRHRDPRSRSARKASRTRLPLPRARPWRKGIVTGGRNCAVASPAKRLADLHASLSGDEASGVQVFSRRAPVRRCNWIAANAGLDGSVVVNKVAELPVGQRVQRGDVEIRRLWPPTGSSTRSRSTRSAVLKRGRRWHAWC